MEISLRVKLDEILQEKKLNQKQLIALIEEKTGVKVRPAAISELYNNQRKSLNKELIETIATTLGIHDSNEFFSFDIKKPTEQ